MKKDELTLELAQLEDELLSVHNKVQEAINLERDGKWYHADTKLQGTKQKIMNLYEGVQSLKRDINSEDNPD